MRNLVALRAATALALLAAPTARAGGFAAILDCDFDTKAVDQPIGLGGAARGEPTSAGNVDATVRATPLPTPCLELKDISSSAGTVRFQFLGDAAVSERSVVLDFDIRFATLDTYGIQIREAGSSTQRFLDLDFGPDGTVVLSDEDTFPPVSIGTYQSDHTYHVRIRFDWDALGGAGTYAVRVDGVPIIQDRPFTSTLGVGSIAFQHLADGDLTGKFWIDDLVVITDADVTPVSPTSWAAIKAAWRD